MSFRRIVYRVLGTESKALNNVLVIAEVFFALFIAAAIVLVISLI